MAKIFLVSLLLMLVYSWEEFKYSAKFFLRFFLYQRRFSPASHPKVIDRFVSMSIGLAVIPLGLALFLESHPFSIKNLIFLAAGLLVIASVASFASVIGKRLSGVAYYEHMSAGALAFVSMASIVSPGVRLFTDFDFSERKALAKFALYLSLPALVGLALKIVLGQSYIEQQFLPSLDLLVEILVIALLINIAITFVEKNLRSLRFRGLSLLFRVLVGIVLSFSLIF